MEYGVYKSTELIGKKGERGDCITEGWIGSIEAEKLGGARRCMGGCQPVISQCAKMNIKYDSHTCSSSLVEPSHLLWSFRSPGYWRASVCIVLRLALMGAEMEGWCLASTRVFVERHVLCFGKTCDCTPKVRPVTFPIRNCLNDRALKSKPRAVTKKFLCKRTVIGAEQKVDCTTSDFNDEACG